MPSSKSDGNLGAQRATAGLLLSGKGDHNLTMSSADAPENPGLYPPLDSPR